MNSLALVLTVALVTASLQKFALAQTGTNNATATSTVPPATPSATDGGTTNIVAATTIPLATTTGPPSTATVTTATPLVTATTPASTATATTASIESTTTLNITTSDATTEDFTSSGGGVESTTVSTTEETTSVETTTTQANTTSIGTTATNTSPSVPTATTGVTTPSESSQVTSTVQSTAEPSTPESSNTTTQSTVTTTKPTTASTTKPSSTSKPPTTTTPVDTTHPHNDNQIILIVLVLLFIIILIVFLIVLYLYCKKKDLPCMGKDRGDSSLQLVNVHKQSTKKVRPFTPGHMVISKAVFESHYLKNIADDKKGFREEYKAVKNEPKSHAVASNPTNQPLNRYENVLPYDETRVTLNGSESGYINANFLPGYLMDKKFIACQGPKDNTENDMWLMIWEQRSAVIVMVTNLIENNKPKCHQYWPHDLEPGSMKEYGDFKVTFVESKIRTFYTYRQFKIEHFDEPSRLVHQLHYTAWPDFGVPKSAAELLMFRRRVVDVNPSHAGPIVVHCSAGVGRTGTYILIDAAIEQIEAEGKVDMFTFLCKMRKNRMMVIQTEAQYAFAHLAVLEHIKYGNTEVPVSKFRTQCEKLSHMSEDSEDSVIEDQFNKLVKIPLVKEDMKSGKQSSKNRVLQIIPYDSNRVTIPRKPGQERSDYINASFIDGFKERREYIATQAPLDNTIEDFWSMVWHYQVQTIVMMTNIMERGQEVSVQYWPEKVGDTAEYGRVTITQNECHNDNDVVDYTVREFTITHQDSTDEDRTVRQYQYHGWPEVGQPLELEGLMEIIARVNNENLPPRPIVVHCSAGGGRTGIFCALSIMINRVECEGLIDVFQTVKKLRDQRPHIIQTKEQLSFCYTTMLQYLESNEMGDTSTLTSDIDIKPNGEPSTPIKGKAKGNGYINMAMEADISGSMNNQLDLESQDNQSENTTEAQEDDPALPPPPPEDDLPATDKEESGSEFELVVNKDDVVV